MVGWIILAVIVVIVTLIMLIPVGADIRYEDGVVRLVPVVTGIQDGQFVEILSGLKAGEQAVAKTGAYVRDGDRINPVKSAQPATN